MRECIICGEQTYSPHARYCKSCRDEQEKEYLKRNNERAKKRYQLAKKPPKPPANQIEATVREIKLYNKKHGTRYNYGEYTAKKRKGWL
jgi:hypothetical protein